MADNLRDIEKILASHNMRSQEFLSEYENALELSSRQIIDKWSTGRKYARTLFTMRAFDDLYPDKVLELSIMVDVMVNILDDFYDEIMSKEERALNLIEFLRVFSKFNQAVQVEKVREPLSLYYNKLISLALAEKIFAKAIAEENELETVVKLSVKLLLFRGMDMDIFNEIAVAGHEEITEEKEIIKVGRIFRAINILKKDIEDIEYDKKNNLDSVVINVIEREEFNFEEYVFGILNTVSSSLNEENKAFNDVMGKNLLPIINYQKMIEDEKEEIIRSVDCA